MKLSDFGKTIALQSAQLSIEKQKLIEQLKPHIDIMLAHEFYDKGEIKRFCFAGDPDEWGEDSFGEDGLYVLVEYNDACHCHPEYHSKAVLISWDEMDMTPEEYKASLEQKREAAAKAKAEAERKQKEEARKKYEAQELATFQKLKAKYEGPAQVAVIPSPDTKVVKL